MLYNKNSRLYCISNCTLVFCIYQYFLAHETVSKVQRKYHYIEYTRISTLCSTLLGYSYRAKYCVIFSQRDIFILLHLISQYLNHQCIDDNVDKIQVCISMLSFKTVLPSKIPRWQRPDSPALYHVYCQ